MKPQDLLPDNQNTVTLAGMTVRKGSVGAFLLNWQQLQNPALTPTEHQQAKQDLLALIPALAALGLFEVLVPRDPVLAQWVNAALSKAPAT